MLFPESLLAFLKVLYELSHKVITCLLNRTVTHSVTSSALDNIGCLTVVWSVYMSYMFTMRIVYCWKSLFPLVHFRSQTQLYILNVQIKLFWDIKPSILSIALQFKCAVFAFGCFLPAVLILWVSFCVFDLSFTWTLHEITYILLCELPFTSQTKTCEKATALKGTTALFCSHTSYFINLILEMHRVWAESHFKLESLVVSEKGCVWKPHIRSYSRECYLGIMSSLS